MTVKKSFFKLRTKCTCGKKFPQRCGVTKKVKTCFNPNDCEKEFFLNYDQNVHVGKNFLNDVELRKSVKTSFNPNDCEKEVFFKLRTKCTCGKKFPQQCGVTKKCENVF